MDGRPGGNKLSASYLRNFIFGVEDSLVATVGLLSGIAVANAPRSAIFLTGVVFTIVEGFSMAAGSFLSEYSVEEYTMKAEKPSRGDYMAGIVMFFSYFVSGFIPLAPYLFLAVNEALKLSIILSIIALFMLGVVGARISGTGMFRNALRMTLVGGIAFGIGMIAGRFVPRI